MEQFKSTPQGSIDRMDAILRESVGLPSDATDEQLATAQRARMEAIRLGRAAM